MSQQIGPPGRGPQVNVYEAVGGQPFFDELVERFYEGVEQDPLLRPMYPEDLTDAKRHLALFFGQYWGGPTTYSQERGHPALRMRHAPFTVDAAARDAWLRHMTAALDSVVRAHGTAPELEAAILDYLLGAADFLVNTR